MQRKQKIIIENGIFYTPEAVAKELAVGVQEHLSTHDKLHFFDPSSGEGVLLRAVENLFGNKNEFYGCDLFHSPKFPVGKNWKFTQANFFEHEDTTKFDVIVTNPPYIQYGRLPKKNRVALYERYSKDVPIHKNCDLWLYFLLKSISHLSDNGVLAAVIPWSFLEADFAHQFRAWLASKFKSIDVLVLRDRHFETTEKRVLLLWLSGYGYTSESIKIGFSEHVENEHSYSEVTPDAWGGAGLMANVGFQTENLLAQARNAEFRAVSTYASVQIGVVTGANDYFILDKSKAVEFGFGEKASFPIFTTTADLQGLEAPENVKKVLIQFSHTTQRRIKYIEAGLELGFNKRSHCRRRNPWYHVDPGKVPDAIFSYRVSTIPYMALNTCGSQCTNTLHKIFFNSDVCSNQRKWIALSILSSISQLSLEHHGRHYGNGILKIEPSALKSALVFAPKNIQFPTVQFQAVSNLLHIGKKEEAAVLATSIVMEYSILSNEYWERVKETLAAVRDRRR